MCNIQGNIYIFCNFIMFKSLPGLDPLRFVYLNIFSTNRTPMRPIVFRVGQIQKKDCKYKYSSFSIGKYRYKYRWFLEGKYRYTESKYKYKYKYIQLEPQTAIRDKVWQKKRLTLFCNQYFKVAKVVFFLDKTYFFPGQWIKLDKIPFFLDKIGKNGQNWKKKLTFMRCNRTSSDLYSR